MNAVSESILELWPVEIFALSAHPTERSFIRHKQLVRTLHPEVSES